MNNWIKLFLIELKSLFLSPAQYLGVLVFFVATVSLIPLTLGANPNELSIISTSAIWMLFLLSTLLIVQHLFVQDLKTGLIEQIIISGKSLSIWVFIKVLSYFVIVGIPLIVVSPLMAASLYFDSKYLADFYLILTLLTPSLFLLCSIAASFSAATGGNFILLSMISFPLCIPLFILGASALDAAMFQINMIPFIKMLSAILLLTVLFCPFVSGKILRVLFQ